MYFVGLRQMRTAPNDHLAVSIIFFYFLLDVFLYTIQFPCRQKFSVRKIRHTIFIAADAYKFFYMAIPRCNIFIPDWPVNCKTIACGALKFILAPSLRLPCP